MSPPILAHEKLTADGAEPEYWLLILPGIFGTGRNWATVARRFVRARPDWGAVLVDLRQHGDSQGFQPPHTVAAAAADVAALAAALPGPATGVLGHSFGGKVALAHAAGAPQALRQVWVADSTPESREPAGSAWAMLGVVRELPVHFSSREELVAALTARGVERPVAQWMATNLEREAAGILRWRFDVDAIEALMRDFFRTDLWDVVESPPVGIEIHFIRATRSSVLSDEAAARVRAAGGASLHDVAGGHWLNADAPDALVALLAETLPE
jgi:pimeloyl-ACP methyl ester carboxylesterase